MNTTIFPPTLVKHIANHMHMPVIGYKEVNKICIVSMLIELIL